MELDLEKVKKQLKFSSKKCQNTVKSKLYSIVFMYHIEGCLYTQKNKETQKTNIKKYV